MIGLAELERQEERRPISTKHRVLIAAAVAAVLGPRVRIGEIRRVREARPVQQMRLARVRMEAARAIARTRATNRVKPRRETKIRETPDQA